MRWRRTGRRKVGRKSGQNGLSCAIFSAYSTKINAGIAQLVEQLICNQQVVGSNPTAGSIVSQGVQQHCTPPCLDTSWTLLWFCSLLNRFWFVIAVSGIECSEGRKRGKISDLFAKYRNVFRIR